MDRTRASDTERERVVDILREAHTHGRITVDELDERSAAAYGAATRGELATLIEDLPQPPAPPPPRPAPAAPPPRSATPSYRSPAPPPWVKPWPGLRGWMPGWQLFAQTWRVLDGPDEAGRLAMNRLVPVFTRLGFKLVHRSDDQLVLQSHDDVVTIDLLPHDDHTEIHVWGVAPRKVREQLESMSR